MIYILCCFSFLFKQTAVSQLPHHDCRGCSCIEAFRRTAHGYVYHLLAGCHCLFRQPSSFVPYCKEQTAVRLYLCDRNGISVQCGSTGKHSRTSQLPDRSGKVVGTDGVDGLATGVTLPVMVFFLVTAIARGKAEIAFFPAVLLGGLFGFLCYNFHPAKTFMGDTGSLFLGGAVCGLAFALDMPLILILVGFVYIVETVSVIMQVTYFKATHGKRIFKMTPIHHHFELCGWSEVKIFVVFTAVSLAMCVLAWFATAPIR